MTNEATGGCLCGVRESWSPLSVPTICGPRVSARHETRQRGAAAVLVCLWIERLKLS